VVCELAPEAELSDGSGEGDCGAAALLAPQATSAANKHSATSEEDLMGGTVARLGAETQRAVDVRLL